MKYVLNISLLFFLVTGLTACKKDKKNDPAIDTSSAASSGGYLKIVLEDKVDTAALVFGHNYVNAVGDTFTLSKFNYFISNIVLTRSDNSTYSETYSYHLVKHSSPGTAVITLTNVPAGAYTSLSLVLGVDSAMNVSGAHTGDLDFVTASDMFWDWNTGYIFLKLEGSSPISGAPDKSLTFHIGGYGGPNKAQRNFSLGLGTGATVSGGLIPQVHLSVNAAELFKTPNPIDFSLKYNWVGAGPTAKIYADNYADMITFEKITN